MSVLLLPLGLTLGLPLILSGALAFLRQRSLLDWLISALLCAGIAVYMYSVGPIWAWIGVGWRFLPLAGALAAVLWSARRLRGRPVLPPRKPLALAGTSIRCATAALVAWMVVDIHIASLSPAGAVDLSFPLERGRYVTIHGGGTTALNPHRAVPAQSWAVDIVALNDQGRRARGVRPEALAAYEIFD
ncbi:MAG: hypothetical protein OXC11_13555, partial [Rhodospirillales bacterium]|nr:hypothetical protein [Rhodospirillales bacterium]